MCSNHFDVILIEDTLDDEVVSLRAIKHSGVPCSVGVYREAGEALEYLLNADMCMPRVVLLDMHLHKSDGLEVLRRIRANARTESLPVVLLSGSDHGSKMKEGYDAGASSYVVKPVDFEQYMRQVGLITQYWLTVNCAER